MKINGRRVVFRDLIVHNILSAGDQLRLNHHGDSVSATVGAEAQILLSDGRSFESPSKAAMAAMNVNAVNGWLKWTAANGATLAELRLKLPGLDADPPERSASASLRDSKTRTEPAAFLAPAPPQPLPLPPKVATEPFFGLVPGLPVGSFFRNRQELRDGGVHRPLQAGIDGNKDGAYSVVVGGGYIDDHDGGNYIVYTGHGGNDPATKRQIKDQEWTRGNAALRLNQQLGLPVRVARGHKGEPAFSPASGYRYDGIFQVEQSWDETGVDGFKICRFRLVAFEDVSPAHTPLAPKAGAGEPYQPKHAAQAQKTEPAKSVGPPPEQHLVSQPGLSQRWVKELVATPKFSTVRERHTRLHPEKVEAVLSFLDANGGQLSHEALAHALELPITRLPGLVATISSAINLDGYPVIKDDGERVTLDSNLAAHQFGIG